MWLCKNGRSVRMGFIIRHKSDGAEVADISAIIPIADMDDDYRWWELGVLAYLHDRNLPTHWEERNKYTATAKLDFQTRHFLVEKALAERQTQLEANRTQRQAAAKARREAKKDARLATPKQPEPPQYPPPLCPICGYHDPHFGKVACPNGCDEE